MGAIIGGVIGGIGSIIGSGQAAKHEKQAAQSALTGYNYLNSNPLIGQLQSGASTALTGQQNTTGAIQQLLTSPSQDNPAFKNYLNSTGYNFQMQQGTDAITGNAASKGLLNSGATARGLETFGQGLAGQYFNNYLGQLGSLNSQYGTQVAQGQRAAETVGQAGTTGGNNAGNFQAQVGQSVGSGISNAFNTFGGGVQNYMTTH